MVDAAEFKRRLETLAATYRASLPTKLAELAQDWQRLEAGESGAGALADLERSAHSIAGSAASFGLPQAGVQARKLEDFLGELRSAARMPRPEDGEKFRSLFAALERASAPPT